MHATAKQFKDNIDTLLKRKLEIEALDTQSKEFDRLFTADIEQIQEEIIKLQSRRDAAAQKLATVKQRAAAVNQEVSAGATKAESELKDLDRYISNLEQLHSIASGGDTPPKSIRIGEEVIDITEYKKFLQANLDQDILLMQAEFERFNIQANKNKTYGVNYRSTSTEQLSNGFNKKTPSNASTLDFAMNSVLKQIDDSKLEAAVAESPDVLNRIIAANKTPVVQVTSQRQSVFAGYAATLYLFFGTLVPVENATDIINSAAEYTLGQKVLPEAWAEEERRIKTTLAEENAQRRQDLSADAQKIDGPDGRLSGDIDAPRSTDTGLLASIFGKIFLANDCSASKFLKEHPAPATAEIESAQEQARIVEESLIALSAEIN